MTRCDWAGPEQIYLDYHDTEWGVPEWDSRALWEKLILDGFQAGLSWITILKKREAFRDAFEGFDPHVIAQWGEGDVQRLLGNAGIIRHRGKIEATITNAQAWLRMEEQGGFDTFMWGYVGGVPLQNNFVLQSDVPPKTALSEQVSKDLRQAGFKFCGPTIVYAWMEACGLVNDHLVGCPRHGAAAKMQKTR